MADLGWSRYIASMDDRCIADERNLDVDCDDCPFQVECGRPNTASRPTAPSAPAAVPRPLQRVLGGLRFVMAGNHHKSHH